MNETGLFGFWSVILQTTGYAFMLFRDVLGAGVSFVAGNILNVSYSIAL